MEDKEIWLQIMCAVIAGRYKVYIADVQDANSVMDLTDDWYADFKERWPDVD